MAPKSLALVIALAGCIFAAALIGGFGEAQAGLTLEPFRVITLEIPPGGTATTSLSLSSTRTDAATDIAVEVLELTNAQNGDLIAGTSPATSSPLSAAQYVTVQPGSFRLGPGTKQEITATIRLPEDIEAGGRYAIVSAHQTQPREGAPLGSLSGFNIPLFVTVQGTEMKHTAVITDPVAMEKDGALEVTAWVRNTGNHHFKPRLALTLTDSANSTIGSAVFLASQSPIVPGAQIRATGRLVPGVTAKPGEYRIRLEILLDDGTVAGATTKDIELASEITASAADRTLQSPSSSPAAASDGIRLSWAVLILVAGAAAAFGGTMFFLGARRTGRGH